MSTSSNEIEETKEIDQAKDLDNMIDILRDEIVNFSPSTHLDGVKGCLARLISEKARIEPVSGGGEGPLDRGDEKNFHKYKYKTKVVAHIYSHELNHVLMGKDYERTRDLYVDNESNFRRTSERENSLHSIIDHRLMKAIKEQKKLNMSPVGKQTHTPQDFRKRIQEQVDVLKNMKAFSKEKIILDFYRKILSDDAELDATQLNGAIRNKKEASSEKDM